MSDCKLFKTWPKGKIEKMSNSCMRHTFDAGEYIFHQGDPPNDLCIIVEGNVNIVKELVIVCKNRYVAVIALTLDDERVVSRLVSPVLHCIHLCLIFLHYYHC